VVTEGYIAEERDFRSTLVRVRDANPDGLILISYYSDGALIARQARQVGLKQAICAASSVYSPKFLELGGEAVEGVHLGTRYFPGDPRPEVRKFVTGFKAKYGGQEPDSFNAYSYDAMNMAAAVLKIGGTDRKAIRDAFAKVHDVSTVIFGPATFDVETRRIKGAMNAELVVQKGQFTLWDGKPT
jgi:branched-chain amino acid transport system substrate-binding protein